ncbi:GNAT family protein [Nocardioides marinquilinus]|uniref:GNAT family protein n=1 Tax=Nocardioides marinquilinus TaxID=1210400 RepID=A0ABP9Q1M1_9ACTN
MIPAGGLPVELPLRTERLVLRQATDRDVDAVLAYCGDDDVVRHLPFGRLDRDGVVARMQRWHDELATDPDDVLDRDWFMTLVVEHEGGVVGDVMLRLGPQARRSVAEIGYVFSPAVAGRGFATESARRLVDAAFADFGCHRVTAMLDPANTASARVCERLGMTREADLRRDWFGDGEWSDTTVFGLLREEWTPTRRL